MSEWKQHKHAFISGLVSGGPVASSVPPRITERWARKLHAVGEPTWTPQRRLANRFKLGADPEFVISDGRQRLDAAAGFGMVPGAFIGADQNGRLAEVRPCPSRSALEVVASIWLELEMGTRLYDLGRYQLLAGAFIYNDGIGGHIHVGRKRPWRASEVNALDALYFVMLDLGMFPADQQAQRQGGDQHRQQYGLPSDFRPQAHGYEYRTLPSFLDSPTLAFLSLTLAKCAILGRSMVAMWHALETRPVDLLLNLLAFYAPVDDDARLAYYILRQKGVPKYIGGDFKARWGLHRRSTEVPANRPALLPGNLKPGRPWIERMFEHLRAGTALTLRGLGIPEVRTTLPTGSQVITNGGGQGIGDVITGLVTPRGLPVEIRAASSWGEITLTAPLAEALGADRMRRLLPKLPLVQNPKTKVVQPVTYRVIFGDTRLRMYIPDGLRQPATAGLTRRALASGVLPIWDGTKVETVPQWIPPRAGKGRYL